jgi:hypothetical protein
MGDSDAGARVERMGAITTIIMIPFAHDDRPHERPPVGFGTT